MEDALLSRFDNLVEFGLVLYDEKQKIIEHVDGDLKFQFCLTSALARKPTLQTQPDSECNFERRNGSDINTSGFEMGDVSSTHFLAANKFCFARPHLMLLTSDGHQKQYEPLCENDFEAAWSILTTVERDYVTFFNCGRDGGCSRLHKHLQLMPMPAATFASFLDSKEGVEPDIPFHWFYYRIDAESMTPATLAQLYDELLERASAIGRGRSEHAASMPPGSACPHNMILTKRWMLVLPRRRAAINKEAGANAIGMLGLIAVATGNEIDNWIKRGLTNSLRELAFSRET